MRRLAAAVAIAVPLAACGHSDLKAPCGPLSSGWTAMLLQLAPPLWPLAAGANEDCGPLKPANG